MNLILAGGGSGKQTVRVNTLFVSLLKNKNILYIPVARYFQEYEDCFNKETE
jgi:hypothetical protein